MLIYNIYKLYIDIVLIMYYNTFMIKEDNKYIALIADIVNSRKIQNREIFQKEFINVIKNVNITFKDSIVSKFVITTGDEFQGLVSDARVILDILTNIRFNLKNVNFRCGIGIGCIVTEIDKNMAIGADGPVYYMARDAINYVKKNENSNKKAKTDIVIYSDEDNVKLSYINILFKNNYYLYNRMSEHQKYLVNYFILNDGVKEKDTSDLLKISQQSINKSLHSAGFYYYKENYECIKKIMGELKNVN